MTSRLRTTETDGREMVRAILRGVSVCVCVCVYVRVVVLHRSVAAGLLGRSPVHAWEAHVSPQLARWCR
jgi:hypothetical protein